MANNYLNLIKQAISDFDSAWTELNKKGSVVSDYIDATASIVDDVVPTSHYGTIISKLTYIKGLTANSVNHYTSASEANALGEVTVSKGAKGVYTVNTSIATPGYYAVGAKVTAQLNSTTVDLDTDSNWVENEGVYSLSANDYVIGAITAKKGTVKNAGDIVEAQNGAISTTATVAALAKNDEGSNTSVATVDSSKYMITVRAGAATSGKLTASVTNTVTPGYVKASDAAAVWTKDFDVNSTDSEDLTIHIQEGAVKVQSVSGSNATASIGDGGAGILVSAVPSGEDAKNYYELTSAIEGLQIEAEVTEGYVGGGKINANASDIKLGSGTKYIKKGASKNQTLTLTDAELKVTGGSSYLTTTGGKEVTITVPDTTTRTADIDAGYITTGGTITLAGTKTVNIKEGTGVAKAAITSYGLSATGVNVSETSTAGAYAFTVTPTVSVDTTGFSAGWIDSIATTGAGANNVSSKTYYIGAGSVSVAAAPTFNATVVDQDDGKSAGVSIGDIFFDAVPATGDYIKIDSSVSYSVTEGYVKASSGTPSTTKYLKKAVIELVQEKDDNGQLTGEEYFSVKEGGYLPSGTLNAVSTFEPSLASVAVNLSGVGITTGDFTSEQLKNYHTITISKGTVDAGYMSATQGALSGTYYLQKGSVATDTTISAAPKSVTRIAGDTVKYAVTSTVTANAGLTVGEGYVTTSEVSGTKEKTQDVTYEVARASFGTTTHTTNASITAASGIRVIEGTEAAVYTVTPKIDSCSTKFTVATDGYISSKDGDILKFEGTDQIGHDGKMTSLSIHAGTGITAHTESQGKVNVSDNFADSVDGAYTVTVGGTVGSTITLDTGYYGETEKSQTAEFAVSKTYSVAHGKATVTSTGSATVSATDVKLYDSKAEGKTYYQIDATPSVTHSKSGVTPGYMKDVDITLADTTITAGKAFVEAYTSASVRSTENVAPEGTTQISVTIGQISEDVVVDGGKILATAEKFNKKDIAITLSEHAMGSSVVSEFDRLAARLAGKTAVNNA